MSGVDVSGLKAGQRVRATFEGELANGDYRELSTQGVYVRLYDVDPPNGLVAVEVLPDAMPEWISKPGEVVRGGKTTWVRHATSWVAAERYGIIPDSVVWQDVQRGVAVRLTPEPTP